MDRFCAVSTAFEEVKDALSSNRDAIPPLRLLKERLDALTLPLDNAAQATTLDHAGVWLWNRTIISPLDMGDKRLFATCAPLQNHLERS